MKTALPVVLVTLLLAGCAGLPPELESVLGQAGGIGSGAGSPIAGSEAAQGLKEALVLGTTRTIERVGVLDGFWTNRDIQIPLPENLRKVEKTLRVLGQGRAVDDFHLSLNRAAEAAAPEAAAIFSHAIRTMSFDDAMGILRGPSNAATEYFRGKTQAALAARFRPIVARATDRVGATRKYKEMSAKLSAYAPGVASQDIDAYVTDRALGGLFLTLAQEETRIRRDPAARTTELLKRVFGSP